MKSEYDFSQAARGAVVRSAPGKTRITIRLDNDVLEWFRSRADAAGGSNYQTLINQALRECIDARTENLDERIRRIVREELAG